MSRAIYAGLFALALSAAACGDDDAPAADAALPVIDSAPAPDAPVPIDASPPDATPSDAAPSGTLTIQANGVTGVTGKVVLVFVTVPGGGPILGGICEPVMSDPDDVSGIAKVPMMGNPCALGAEVIFDNGSYDLIGGIYTPGMMTPDACSNGTVEVLGDTTVIMPAFGPCP